MSSPSLPSYLTTDYTNHPQLTGVESQILTQYQQLSRTLLQLSLEIQEVTNSESAALVENLRTLETKLSLVSTLFKGAVYTLFLQQEESMDPATADVVDHHSREDY